MSYSGFVRLELGYFLYWACERHAIHLRRLAKLPSESWSANHIMRDHRWCNVFRELDRETIWIRKNWREKHPQHVNLPLALLAARRVNWSPTLAELSFPKEAGARAWFEWCDHFESVVRARRARGEKAWTSAYMISNGGTTMPKEAYFTQTMRAAALKYEQYVPQPSSLERGVPAARAAGLRSIEDWTKFLKTLPGAGTFIAYEVATDLRHTPFVDPLDKDTYANAGPGAKRGLNRLVGRDVRTAMSPKWTVELMRELLIEWRAYNHRLGEGYGDWVLQNTPLSARELLPSGYAKLIFPVVELRDVEHVLCEYDKFRRLERGEGTVRAGYKPAAQDDYRALHAPESRKK